MIKTWGDSDQEFLVECRAIEYGRMTMAEFYGIDEVHTLEESVPAMLEKFADVFDWLEKLPPKRSIEHHIHLKKDINPINVRPYWYAYHQKEEMEKLVGEVLSSRVIRSSVVVHIKVLCS